MKPLSSIRAQLTVIIFLGVLLPLAGGLGVGALHQFDALEKNILSRNLLTARLAAEYCAVDLAFVHPEDAARQLALVGKLDEVLYAGLYDAQGRLFAAFPAETKPDAPAPPVQLADPQRGSGVTKGDGYVDVSQPVSHREDRYGTLVLRISDEPLRQLTHGFFWSVGLVAVGLGLFALAFAFMLQRVISRPILALSSVAQRITENADYSVRVKDPGRNEIGKLSQAFNTMVAEIQRRDQELQHSRTALLQSYEKIAKTQEELVEKERLAAVGEMSAAIAHEMRNSLGVIFNVLEALKPRAPSDASSQMMGFLREEADRLNRIVEDLLNFARPREAERVSRPLEPLIAHAVGLATYGVERGRFNVNLDIPSTLPPLAVDERMMRQMILNLMLNALQAMPGGGEITVRAREEERDGARHVRVDVADSGPGVSPEAQAKLFQPFFTTKATGTGLGLAVVRRFAEAHRGSVSVSTQLGRGTTFSLHFPLVEPPQSLSTN